MTVTAAVCREFGRSTSAVPASFTKKSVAPRACATAPAAALVSTAVTRSAPLNELFDDPASAAGRPILAFD